MDIPLQTLDEILTLARTFMLELRCAKQITNLIEGRLTM